jgi:hypothetical protein
VIKDILALRFNPGGPTAEIATADQGLSILVCRPLTAEGKAAIRRKELLDATSKRKTVTEAELEMATALPLVFPDTFNELHVCIGTYCALLHTLFGERCVFFKHCYTLWTTMNGEAVYDHRHLFTVIFCRQILWAIIEYGRAYFAQRMSNDDFEGKHPDEIRFPRSNLIELEPAIRTLAPIVRSSFPTLWTGGGTLSTTGAGAPPTTVGGYGGSTVISAVTAGSQATSRRGSQRGTQREQFKLRSTNIHPLIKTAMEPYVKKVQAIRLSQMLNHVNLRMDDLPTLPAGVGGSDGVCYNYMLGLCSFENCPRKDSHIMGSEIPDEFATDLLAKLRPAITEFTANGAPTRPKRRRRE